jgi:uncharacterized protein (DUF305 family)
MIYRNKASVHAVIHWSLHHRWLTGILALVLLILASYAGQQVLVRPTTPPTVANGAAAYQAASEAAMGKMMSAMSIPSSGHVDKDFVAQMVPHHQAAIAMAQAELRYGHNPRLLNLAREIIVTEQADIAIMQLPLTSTAPSQTARSNESQYLTASTAAMGKMMSAMDVPSSGNVDKSFVAQMVPHHQGGIAMAQDELRYGHDQTLTRLAQEIIVIQLQEITALQQALGK